MRVYLYSHMRAPFRIAQHFKQNSKYSIWNHRRPSLPHRHHTNWNKYWIRGILLRISAALPSSQSNNPHSCTIYLYTYINTFRLSPHIQEKNLSQTSAVEWLTYDAHFHRLLYYYNFLYDFRTVFNDLGRIICALYIYKCTI